MRSSRWGGDRLGGGLGQNAAQGEVGRVCLEGEGQLGFKVVKDGSSGEGLLQLVEGCICCSRPGKLDILTAKGSQRR